MEIEKINPHCKVFLSQNPLKMVKFEYFESRPEDNQISKVIIPPNPTEEEIDMRMYE